jgi:hypothetical protein
MAKKMNKYGTQIDKVYPLLDPDITDEEERRQKHAVWFKSSISK